MPQLLVENHLRKRARLSKDLNFKHDIYEPNIGIFGNADSTIEEFIDKLADNFDPTYNPANPTQGSMYLDYIIDNIKRGIINLNVADGLRTRRILQGYTEDQSSPTPRLQKELQRYYRDIPSLEQALSDVSKVNAAELIADPRYVAYYAKEGSGAYGGLTEKTFYDTLADLFDPSPNQRYMKYIISNLLPSSDSKGKVIPPNITKEESAMVKSVLAAHMTQVENGNPKIKQDVARFYPKIKFDLINALQPYMIEYNTTDNTTEAFNKTKELFRQQIGTPIYQTNKHLFYLVRTQEAAKRVISTKTSSKFNEFRRHCTGYWCVSEMPDYFPIYLTVDVYGFVDYAIVPKPDYQYGYGELKNRFNSPLSTVLMDEDDYESLLKFFLSDNSVFVESLFERLDLSGNTDNFHNDFFKFLLRSKDIATVEKLTGKKFNSANDFIFSIFGVNEVSGDSANYYASTILPRFKTFQSYFNIAPDNYPMFSEFKGKAIGDTSGTILDSKEFVSKLFEAWKTSLQALINSYIKDSSKSLGTTTNIKELNEAINGAQAKQVRLADPARYKKVVEIVAKKIDDGTIRIEGPMDVPTVDAVYKTIIEPVISTAIRKQLEQYLKLGGITELTLGTASFPHAGFTNIIKLIGPDISNKAKLHILKIYFDVFKRDVTTGAFNHQAAESRAVSILEGLKQAAKILKIEDSSIAIAFARSIDASVQNGEQVADFVVRRVYNTFKKYYDDRIKTFDKETPSFVRSLAQADRESTARKLHADKYISLSQSYLPPSSRLQMFKRYANSLGNATFDARNSSIDITGRRLDSIVSLGTRYRIYQKVTKWDPIEILINVAAADGRSFNYASIASDHFLRIRESINMLITTYKAVPVALYVTDILNGFLIDSTEKIISAYKRNDYTLSGIEFYIVVRLEDGRLVAVNQRGKILNGLTSNDRIYGCTASEFQQKMQTYAHLDENRITKVRSFDSLFERVDIFSMV